MLRKSLVSLPRQAVQTRHYSPLPTSVLAALPSRPGGPRISRSSRPDRRPSGSPRSDHDPQPDPAFGQYGGGFQRQQPFQPEFPYMGAQPGFGGGGGGGPSLASQVPVHMPSDPDGVLRETDGAVSLLANSALVIVRQIEMLNVFMGFEQANRYAIMNPQGEHVGYLAEEGQGFLSAMMRQTLRTHRPFRSVVMDKYGTPILWIRRPFAFINSKIFVHAGQTETGQDDRLVGEAQQEWHPWRRRYNVFKHRDDTFKQFARIDSGFWAWDFWLRDADDRIMASINRSFTGFGRELFTDTGQYVVRFDAVEQELALNQANNTHAPNEPKSSLIIPPSATDLTLDERAMTLATAVTIDIDYFSRHSGAGGMGFPFFMWGGGMGDEYGRGGSGEAGVGAGGVGTAAGMQEGMQGDMFPGEEVYQEEQGPDIGFEEEFEDPF